MWPEGKSYADLYGGCTSLGELLRRKLEHMNRENALLLDFSNAERRVLSHMEMNPCGEILLDDSKPKPVKRVVRQSPTQKEPQMDTSKLVALADPTWEKDLKDLGIVSDSIVAGELRAEIEAQSAELRKNAVKDAATQILALGRAKTAADQRDVEALRDLRRREKEIKDRLAKRETAWQYGSKTLNYLPIAHDLNMLPLHVIRGLDLDLLKVKVVEEAAAPAA